MKYAAFKNRRWQNGKKTCSRNMAQCRELEKMGSVSRTNCIDRDFKKGIQQICASQVWPFIVLIKQLFHGTTARVSCHSTAICSGIQFKFQSWLSEIHYMVMRSHQTVINSH